MLNIAEKKAEAQSYQDQSCYNAAYCYGYVAGAEEATKEAIVDVFHIITSRLSAVDENTGDMFSRIDGPSGETYITALDSEAGIDALETLHILFSSMGVKTVIKSNAEGRLCLALREENAE